MTSWRWPAPLKITGHIGRRRPRPQAPGDRPLTRYRCALSSCSSERCHRRRYNRKPPVAGIRADAVCPQCSRREKDAVIAYALVRIRKRATGALPG